ncbi:MAG: phosphoribosylamine--glycine ligase [Candidatus Omnitrophica bacterium]|nr:phosphoribosylamine--glycine ligase [Candidatus Omnitrophota bacterium]
MKVLVVGSGGREHALVWKIVQSKLADTCFCAPGNGGIAQVATCVSLRAEDTAGLLTFAKKEKIDLTIIGPEAPLAAGIVDEFTKAGLAIFGPSQRAAQLEASKVFAKELMARHNIPTARFRVFNNATNARQYIETITMPCVIKADGLAAGKGVVIAQSRDQALEAVAQMMEGKVFGAAGERIIIEECLKGEEASIIVLVDANTIIPLASSQDHKRVFDEDRGPNTGGMGAYSPAPLVDEKLFAQIRSTIIEPTVKGLREEGITYRGALYAGIMITSEGPKVLEYNVRFGDPETQAILPRLKSDLLEVLYAASNDNLKNFLKTGLSWETRACVCVVCTSKGYPGNYEKGKEISGLKDCVKMKDVVVFHAGTKKEGEKHLTCGGRVLGVTGLGVSIAKAIDTTYRAVAKIKFDGMHYRTDIGKKALQILK